MLIEIAHYLRDHKRVALRDLAYRFDIAPEALRGMLTVLEQRGRVRQLPSMTPCGGGCCHCDPETIEIYEWIAESNP